jgi:probable F420-dependent oxidoreductase
MPVDRTHLGRVGIWVFQLDLIPSSQATEVVAEVEELGYGAVWIPEAVGREPFTSASLLLRGGERIVVATGIANIWSRDATAAKAAQLTLTEAYPDRFVLGLGVSHQPLVQGLRGHDYQRPYQAMQAYLDGMERAVVMAAGPPPGVEPVTVLGALGPRMLELAAARTAGAHPYNVTPEHTERARALMGPDALLAPEQTVVLETDPTEARRLGREHLRRYLGLPNYENEWRREGFDDADFTGGGSDRLVDAVVAWGDVETIRARVAAHHDAGADHVCVQVIPSNPLAVPMPEWRELAPALLT